MKELERVVGCDGLTEMAQSTWKDIAPNILKQAQLERQRPTIKLAFDLISDINFNVSSAVTVMTMYI